MEVHVEINRLITSAIVCPITSDVIVNVSEFIMCYYLKISQKEIKGFLWEEGQ